MILLAASLMLTGCDDLWNPAPENNRERTEMYTDANYALGILMNGYTRLPSSGWSFNDMATDDAVSNDAANSYRKMATGEWTSDNNPVEAWTNAYAAIQYMNIILEESDNVVWSNASDDLRQMFNDRTKGEAYALRGLYMFYLLQAHAGVSESGKLAGVPVYMESQTPQSDHNVARASFAECVKRMEEDFDAATELLPLDFTDVSDVGAMPARYRGMSLGDYNRVFGANSSQRVTVRIIEAMRSRAALLAASPAFNPSGNPDMWVKAADMSAVVIDRIGGVAGLDPRGHTWYANTSEIDGLAEGRNPKEILWRTGFGDSRYLEEDNYPPTLYGKGRVNPTQNLVDAFPMKNGYPISDSRSGYNTSAPGEGRDPRLSLYIVADGDQMGPSSSTIHTLGTASADCVNQTETSTRTGYYMRKLLRMDVNLAPLYLNSQRHYKPHIRYTEIFLNYAEAANEAWGPDGTGTHAYSAADVVRAIRMRAGICVDGEDPYLEECRASKEKMRAFIRNERRLELCFEGFRFWDLRRWKVEPSELSAPARGTNVAGGSRMVSDVETRNYGEHMYYGPIPYGETLKWSNLEQNQGW